MKKLNLYPVTQKRFSQIVKQIKEYKKEHFMKYLSENKISVNDVNELIALKYAYEQGLC